MEAGVSDAKLPKQGLYILAHSMAEQIVACHSCTLRQLEL